MNPDRILLRVGRQAAALTRSRDPAVDHAARRARGAAAAARAAIATDLDLRLVVASALEALVIVAALTSRDRRAADRRRAGHLKAAARPVTRKVSDGELREALRATGGGVRAAAKLLAVAPSTVSRRAVALRDVAQQRHHPLPAAAGRR